MDDFHSSIFVLSSRGHLIWWTNLGGEFSSVQPVALGKPLRRGQEIVAWWRQGKVKEDGLRNPAGRLVVFDARFNPRSGYEVGTEALSCVADDLDGNGDRQILLTDSDGFLHVLDSNLKLRDKRQITRKPPTSGTNSYTWVDLLIAGVTPLTSGHFKHLILASSQLEQKGNLVWVGNTKSNQPTFFHYDESVIVLNNKLEVMARHTVNELREESSGIGFRVFPVKSDHGPEILTLSRDVQYLKLSRW